METNEIRPLEKTVISNQGLSSLPLDNPSSLPAPTNQASPQGTYEKLNQLFVEQDQQKNVTLEAREILGESAKDLSDSQVYDLVNEVQYLVDSWLEEYERKLFEGKTLEEVMGLDK